MGAAAVVLLFAPVEVASVLGASDPRLPGLALQLYAAALLGLAMTGWAVKDAIIGGIFGRSYVLGNLAHAFAGACALTRPAAASGASPALGVLAAVYWIVALVFGYLMFVAAPSASR